MSVQNNQLDSNEFYEIFKLHDEPLKKLGFARKGRHIYRAPHGIELKIILNHWGWTEEYGWDFFIRLSDIVVPVNGHPQQPSKDLQSFDLASAEQIQQEIDRINRPYLKEHPLMQDSLKAGRFTFYDAEHLRELLKTLLPWIGQAALEWDEKRVETRKTPRPPFRKRTPEEIKTIQEYAEKKLKSLESMGIKLEQPFKKEPEAQ